MKTKKTAQHPKRLEWLTEGIKKSQKTYELLAQISKAGAKNEGIKDHFRKYKVLYKRVLKKSKESCYTNRHQHSWQF